jgi:hypothetical protein
MTRDMLSKAWQPGQKTGHHVGTTLHTLPRLSRRTAHDSTVRTSTALSQILWLRDR